MSSRFARLRVGLIVATALVAASCSSDDTSSPANSAGPAVSSEVDAATSDAVPPATSGDTAGSSAPTDTAMVDSTNATDQTDSTEPAGTSVDSGPAADLEPIVVRQACAPTATAVPSALGEQNGLADEYNISFECVQVAQGPDTITALVAGELDLAGFTAANVFTVLDQGLDLKIFRQSTNVDFFDIIVSPDFPLPNEGDGWEGVMKDLQNARIGVVARGAAAEVLARGLYTQAGLDPDQATYIATGLPNTTLASLSNGEIDAALTFEPGITLAVDQGIAVQPFSIQDGTGPELFNWPGLFIAAAPDSIAENPELYQRYMDYNTAANEYATDPANFDEVVAFAGDFLALDPDVATEVMTRSLAQIDVDGTVDPAGLDAQGTFYNESGSTETAWTAEEITTDVG